MRLSLTPLFVLLMSLFYFQAKSQNIYFEPKEISSECYDSTKLSMEIVFRYSDDVNLTRNSKGSLFLAFQAGKHYKSCRVEGSPEKIDTIDITGDGIPELLLFFRFQGGSSSWRGGNSASGSNLVVYDIRNRKLILDEQLSYHVEIWSNEFEKPLDSLKEDEEIKILDSHTEIDCFNMEYGISNGIITFKPTPETKDCPHRAEISPISLRWTTKGFIKL